MTQPNRHVICYTVTDVSPNKTYSRRTWEGQDAPTQVIRGSLDEAQAVLLARIASDANTPSGSIRILEMTNYRLHSWYEAPRLGFRPPPMAGIPGPDDDVDEITDIPRAWVG